jgi:hypothetical protein
MYGRGVLLALALVVGVLVLPVLWFEVLRFQSARHLSMAVGRGDALSTHLWLLIVDPNNMAYPPLVQAAEAGNEDMVRLLLMRGADVNYRGKEGPTAFQMAASRGHLEVMRRLVAAGAHEDDGYALAMASRDCRPEAVKLLLGQGGWEPKKPLRPAMVMWARSEAEEKGCEAVLRLLPPEPPAPAP